MNTNMGELDSLTLIALMRAPMLGSGQSPPPSGISRPIAFKKSLMFGVSNTVPGSVYVSTYWENTICISHGQF